MKQMIMLFIDVGACCSFFQYVIQILFMNIIVLPLVAQTNRGYPIKFLEAFVVCQIYI